MTEAWSLGLLLPLTALNVKPSRRPASAAALCWASQYGLLAPCSSHTMLGFARDAACAPTPPATAAMAATTTDSQARQAPACQHVPLHHSPCSDVMAALAPRRATLQALTRPTTRPPSTSRVAPLT